jgi:acetoin utilization deacetylase AcuC-like enzyme
MVGFFSSPRFVEHVTGPYHPERPDRIRAIHRAVRDAGLIDSPDPFPDFEIDLGIPKQHAIKLAEFASEPAPLEAILAVHPQSLIDSVAHFSRMNGVLDQGDTPVCPASYEIGLLSAGSALGACEAVVGGKVKRAFSAARPPGHHAEPVASMGFCLFSNIAIAARHAQNKHGVARIAIVDFDVHHGNGTQAVFESDPSVLFVSVHQHPRTCYPGTGHDWEIGVGPGRGLTLNMPLQPGSEDDEYLRAFDQTIIPRVDAFKPELLMISAGFDGHREDPLANMCISDEGFEQITRRLMALSDVHCGGRVVSVLEGGYNLNALGRSVVRHLLAMGS